MSDPTERTDDEDLTPHLVDHPWSAFLDRVEKPARYTGGEPGAVRKDWAAPEARVCLAFPDVYDIGMSHLGFKILYKLLNDDPRTLAERCYAPWVDAERELRARGLPLVSLENKRPLREFDVVGFSLQFELTFSNILSMLDLGGIPLRSLDRGEADPLVIAGGPNATHPEPLAPFVDAFVIGDGEEMASKVALAWARAKREGLSREDRLRAIARLGCVYVPRFYDVREDQDTGLQVVCPPSDPSLPFPIERTLVDLAKYPFPDDGPTGGPEAIFDRMSIEIARGCTEGCRFCQAGMIYRPVRERDPEQIVETIVSAVKKSGQDEASLTALSTADVSCISPLVKKVAQRLAEERVSLGVSSLRAYGLEPELLDELRRVRATGLTFAPEAGTQRMRDVINKNVTEEQLHETAERVFSRGWDKMKLYSMIGLPTETDEDVSGIVEMGARTAAVGKRVRRGKIEVTVSVSTHVPKPHTPFQWCAMDTLSEVERKQRVLRDVARKHKAVSLRTHDATASVLEGVFARGDRRLADVLERAYRHGARFDSWDEQLRLDVWEEAFQHFGVERAPYLGTLPVSARLPWSHIDVGLEDGFLAREYRKALQSRLSPPCGKVAGTFVHPTNVEDAQAETRRLVCYDCGVACDLGQMRDERIHFLDKLGARRLPMVTEEPPAAAHGEPEAAGPAGPDEGTSTDTLSPEGDGEAAEATPHAAALPPRETTWYRLRLRKTGPMALLGHLDAMREVPRVLRRSGLRAAYTRGFHPKPDLSFSPALSLGVASLAEYVDVRLVGRLDPARLAGLPAELTAVAPEGLAFTGALELGPGETGPSVAKPVTLSQSIEGARYVLAFARAALRERLAEGDTVEAWLARRAAEAMSTTALPVRREIEGVGKVIDVRKYLLRAEVGGPEALALAREAGLRGDLVTLDVDVAITGSGSAKAAEVVAALCGPVPPAALATGEAPRGDAAADALPHRSVRAELFRVQGGERLSPMTIKERPAPAPPRPKAEPVVSAP